ncbi:hypothetical protein [Reyranella sp. CPCC 100927]|uniref:hypothetical protein n=1 Tax=Reyranella sp. CPCC 100927 TaxID=2599616 RepID=UPI0015B487AB|nr:hypothetical protein [Reyranella sp. CPCC 100927]
MIDAMRWRVFPMLLAGLLTSVPAAGQPPPGARCGVDVGFEPIGVGTPRPFHAVVLVSAQGGGWVAAFEANPTGRAPSWGWLVARQRDVSRDPLKAGAIVRTGASPGFQTCAWLVNRLRDLAGELNSSRIPYAPAPEAQFNAANSNSFAYWAVSRLRVAPPSAPPGTSGYYANLR